MKGIFSCKNGMENGHCLNKVDTALCKISVLIMLLLVSQQKYYIGSTLYNIFLHNKFFMALPVWVIREITRCFLLPSRKWKFCFWKRNIFSLLIFRKKNKFLWNFFTEFLKFFFRDILILRFVENHLFCGIIISRLS